MRIQRALDGTDTTRGEVPDTVLDVLGSGGQPLDGTIQRTLEDRMDADFSNVRIHTGAKAAEAADAIDAKAFTCGNDIVFNAGEYDPNSAEGQFLLAHELAHVTQQNGGAPISMMPKPDADLQIDPDPQLEREADQAAKEALSGEEPLTVGRLGTEVHVQRVKKDQADKMLAILEGNFQADNAEHQEFLDNSELSPDRRQSLDAQLKEYDPEAIATREADIDINYRNSEQEEKYICVKAAVEVLDTAESLNDDFDETKQKWQRAKNERRQLLNQLENTGRGSKARLDLEERLERTEAEIHECISNLNQIHVELENAIETAEQLWEQADIDKKEQLFITGAADTTKQKLFSRGTVKALLSKIDEKFSQILEIKSLGEHILDIKRARDHSGEIVEGEKETGEGKRPDSVPSNEEVDV
ncbi:eCIS core domain-containing protein [Natrialba chahannaoensis]